MPLSIHTTFCDLSSALKLMGALKLRRSPVPVLEGVLITADPGGVRMETFDFETHVAVNLPCDKITGEGTMLVSLGRLNDYLKSLQSGSSRAKQACLPITITNRADQAVVTADGYTYTLRKLPVEDYPDRPAYQPTASVNVSKDVLLAAVNRVAVCAGSDETLPMLSGVHFQSVDGGLELAATDRFRLGIDFVPTTETGHKIEALVPAKSLQTILKNLPSSGLMQLVFSTTDQGATQDYVQLVGSNVVVSTRLLDAEFVKYRSLLPAERLTDVTVGRTDLETAIKRIGPAIDRGHHARFSFGESVVVVEAGGDDEGRVVSPALPTEQDGNNVLIAFNPKLVGDALKTFDSEAVEVWLNEPHRPMLMAEPGRIGDERSYRTLIMPARLAEATS